jgi:hypothetical protein
MKTKPFWYDFLSKEQKLILSPDKSEKKVSISKEISPVIDYWNDGPACNGNMPVIEDNPEKIPKILICDIMNRFHIAQLESLGWAYMDSKYYVVDIEVSKWIRIE